MTRPLIGITCYVEPASWRVWDDLPTALLPVGYVRQVQAAGGTAVLLPPPAGDVADDVDTALARLDGLVLSGGADVEPSRYHADPHPSVQSARPDRDAWELALAAATAGTPLPVLGICRGMQVMAVAGGGVLEQHLPDRVGHDGHAPAAATYGSQGITIVAGTRLQGLLGDRLDVPCYHHQGVRSHPGYRPAAWAADGTLEAFEDAQAPFRIGVQWHPERGDDPRLFHALVGAAGHASPLMWC